MTRNAKSQGRKSHTKSQNCQAKILHKKTHTFTIIAMNYVQEQLNSLSSGHLEKQIYIVSITIKIIIFVLYLSADFI